MLVPSLLLTMIAGGILYVRLLNGPISLERLADPIARGIEADLPGLRVNVENAAVHMTPSGGFEFRLLNVRFSDEQGLTVAVAPVAAVRLNVDALMAGLIAPARIVLVEPTLQLLYSRDQGLVLSLPDGGGQRPPNAQPTGQFGWRHKPAGPQLQPHPASGRGHPVDAAREVALAKTIVDLVGQARRGSGAAAFLNGVGLRNATLILDTGQEQAVWRVSNAEFVLEHGRDGSVLSGEARFATTGGRWRLSVVAENNDAAESVLVRARLADLIPRTIAATVPQLGALSVLDFPVSGTGAMELSRSSGELIGARFEVQVGAGAIMPGWPGAGRMPIDGGRLLLHYARGSRRISLEPSTLRSGQSWATLRGAITIPALSDAPWEVSIEATDGAMAAPRMGVDAQPIETFSLRGQYSSMGFKIERAQLKVAGGEVDLKGLVRGRAPSGQAVVSGTLSAMSSQAAKLIWPAALAPETRLWTAKQIRSGRILSGEFSIRFLPSGPADDGGAGRVNVHTTIAIEAADIALDPWPGLPVVDIPRMAIKIDGDNLAVTAPRAVIEPSTRRKLVLSDVSLSSDEVSKPDAWGQLTFRGKGAVAAALAIVNPPSSDEPVIEIPGIRPGGNVDAQLQIELPLGSAMSDQQPKVAGKIKVTRGRSDNVFGRHDVRDANLNFDVSEHSVEGGGEFLISGVRAKIAFHRQLGAEDVDQPPLRITTRLTQSDRARLGIPVNAFVRGTVPVAISLPVAEFEAPTHVRVDLSDAELLLEGFAWRKPAGRSASLQFDVVRAADRTLELRKLTLVGSDIALSGSMSFDPKNQLRSFNFPNFSLHVVSRLSISGLLRSDKIWQLKLNGATFVARDLFRSMFSVGRLKGTSSDAARDGNDFDLQADIENVLGFHDLSLRGVRLAMKMRRGQLTSLAAKGRLAGPDKAVGRRLEVGVERTKQYGRRLVAVSEDAGTVFRLVGFYPSMQGGNMQLVVYLDGRGDVEKTGLLSVRRFNILGDPVEEASAGAAFQPYHRRADGRRTRSRGRMVRPRLPFDSMRAPFLIGHGQFVLDNADLRGPVLGVVLKGKADFQTRTVDLGGTYVPIQGLNSAIGSFPILGQILAGPRGEGVFGVTFAIKGSMARPQVLINPVSVGLPGILREMMPMTNPMPRVTPRAAPPAGDRGGAGQLRSRRAPGTRRDRSSTSKLRANPSGRPREGGWSSQVNQP